MHFNLARRLGLILLTGIGAVFVLAAVAISLTISKSESVKTHTQAVLENDIPYVIHLMDLDSQVYKSVNALNVYLITGDVGDKLNFRQQMILLKDLINQQSSLSEADFKTTSLMKVIFHKYNEKVRQVIELKQDYKKNFIGIAKAVELLNPLHLQFKSSLDNVIDSQISESVDEDHSENLTALVRMKTSWNNMILSIRIYFMTRSQKDLQQIYDYQKQAKSDISRLLKLRKQLGFDAVFIDELGQVFNLYIKNLPEVLNLYQTEQWRRDFYITRTEIYPISDSLRMLVRSLVEKRKALTSSKSGNLNAELDGLGYLSRNILIVALFIGLAVLFVVIRNVKALQAQLEIHRKS